MVYKQITEWERTKKKQRNKEMKTEKLASIRHSQWFGCFLDHRLGSHINTKWALMLNMIYPFCTQIFSCLYANIKRESASVMQCPSCDSSSCSYSFRFSLGCCTSCCISVCSTDPRGLIFFLCSCSYVNLNVHITMIFLINSQTKASSPLSKKAAQQIRSLNPNRE